MERHEVISAIERALYVVEDALAQLSHNAQASGHNDITVQDVDDAREYVSRRIRDVVDAISRPSAAAGSEAK